MELFCEFFYLYISLRRCLRFPQLFRKKQILGISVFNCCKEAKCWQLENTPERYGKKTTKEKA